MSDGANPAAGCTVCSRAEEPDGRGSGAGQFDRRRRFPARPAVFRHDTGLKAAPDAKSGRQAHEPGFGEIAKIIENTVGYGLVKRADRAECPDIGLECLEFQTEAVRDIFEFEQGKVRLAGLRAQAGKFRDLDPYRVVTLRVRVFERFQR